MQLGIHSLVIAWWSLLPVLHLLCSLQASVSKSVKLVFFMALHLLEKSKEKNTIIRGISFIVGNV